MNTPSLKIATLINERYIFFLFLFVEAASCRFAASYSFPFLTHSIQIKNKHSFCSLFHFTIWWCICKWLNLIIPQQWVMKLCERETGLSKSKLNFSNRCDITLDICSLINCNIFASQLQNSKLAVITVGYYTVICMLHFRKFAERCFFFEFWINILTTFLFSEANFDMYSASKLRGSHVF